MLKASQWTYQPRMGSYPSSLSQLNKINGITERGAMEGTLLGRPQIWLPLKILSKKKIKTWQGKNSAIYAGSTVSYHLSKLSGRAWNLLFSNSKISKYYQYTRPDTGRRKTDQSRCYIQISSIYQIISF